MFTYTGLRQDEVTLALFFKNADKMFIIKS